MARTGRRSTPSPKGSGRPQDAAGERGGRSARPDGPSASDTPRGDERGSERRRGDAPQDRGQGEHSFRLASAARADHYGQHYDNRRESDHRRGDGEGYSYHGDTRYAHQQQQHQRGSSDRYRRDFGRERDYYSSRGDRGPRNYGGSFGSSWGRDREPTRRDHSQHQQQQHQRGISDRYHRDFGRERDYQYSRGDRGPRNYGGSFGSSWGRDRDSPQDHRGNYHSRDFSEQSMKRQRYGDDSDRSYASRPGGEQDRRPQYDTSSLPRNDYQAESGRRHETNPPPPDPSREMLSEDERLKKELKRVRLETDLARQQTQLARQRLEEELLNKQLRDLQEGKAVACSETSPMPAAKASAARELEDNEDAGGLATRKSPPTKSTGPPAQETSPASRKKKSNRRGSSGGRASLSKETKRQLREAQKAKDEQMKFKLLKAYEEDLAANAMHPYSEKDLMSFYKPDIFDHHLSGSEGKFLVRWVPLPRKGKNTEQNRNECTSWISHEDFLFPAVARKYLLGLGKARSTPPDQTEAMKVWAEDCVERERCLNCLNTFHNDEEFGSNQEIDFCCFVCKCPWDHPLKRTIRNCEAGLKFHRPCCHGYQTSEECGSFVSPVGRVQDEMLELMKKEGGELKGGGDGGGTETAGGITDQVEESDDTSHTIEIVDGECETYRQCLKNRFDIPRRRRDAVVICINAGVGSATESLKRLGVKASRIIHVEADRVAQHVLRSNHDFSYGELGCDDAIEHIVGLFDTLDDLEKDVEQLVQRFGPIDLIIGAAARAKTKEEEAQYANACLDFVQNVGTLNMEHHRFDGLFYLLEISPDVKDHLPLEGLSRCVMQKAMFVCNWPLFLQKTRLLSSKDSSGLPKTYVLDSVRDLFASLRKALSVGFSGERWNEAIHPKLWNFLAMGPNGYEMALSKGGFGPEAFSLRLRTPDNSEFLGDEQYSTHLLGRSSSGGLLDALLTPMQNLYNTKDYGPRYHVLATTEQVTSGTAALEHGGVPPNSDNDDARAVGGERAVKTEVKDERETDDDEEEEDSFAST